MFKNGPIANSGYGLPGVPAQMWQEYDLTGIPNTDLTFSIVVELISIGGTDFKAVIETSPDGATWTPQATLIDWPQADCGQWKFPLYCGSATVPYAPYARLVLTSVWTQQLGQKWVVHSLELTYDGGAEPTPTAQPTETPAPTNTPTPEPTAQPTATPTPTLVYLPIVLEPGNYELFCNGGNLLINGRYVTCEE